MYAKGTHSTTPGIREIRPSGLVSDIPLKESLEVKMEKSVKRLSASMPIRSSHRPPYAEAACSKFLLRKDTDILVDLLFKIILFCFFFFSESLT
jgi:hypothetical protein